MKLPYAVRPLDSVDSAADRAYLAVKRRIIELQLEPGALFTEKEIAEGLGVSKTPVREGLVRLQREGLVAALPRAGYRVAPVTLSDVKDLCDFRQIVESHAAALAAERGVEAEAMERLADLAEELAVPRPTMAGPDLDAFLRDNFEFDALIANHCGNRRLTEAVIQVFDDLERVLRIAMTVMPWKPAPAHQRRQILQAISDRDRDAAYTRMHERTAGAREEILSCLMASPSVANANIPGST